LREALEQERYAPKQGPYVKIKPAIRARFVAYMIDHDTSVRAAAQIFVIKPSTAHSIWARHVHVGDSQPGARSGARQRKATTEIIAYVALLVELLPDLTLKMIAQRMLEEKNLSLSESTIMRVCTSIGFTFKLLRLAPQGRNDQEHIKQRYHYAIWFMNKSPNDQRELIWADECGFNLHIRRSMGRSLRRQRATVTVPNSRGRNISVAAAMSAEGLIYHQTQFGAFNSQLFADWITNLGVILANRGRRNCWLVLDNVRFHHCENVGIAARNVGLVLVFLPAYSPMLNPIKFLFSKWKAAIKTSGVTYTRENLLSSMEAGRLTISINDCLGWIRECERNLARSLQRLPLD
jgi:transposase